MAERLKRAAAWLGLVTDDRYADYDDADAQEMTEGLSREELLGQADRPTDRAGSHRLNNDRLDDDRPNTDRTTHDRPTNVTPLETRRPVPTPTPPTPAPVSQSRTADVSRIITVHPRTYNEARTIGEHFRDGVPVIMNLSDMEDVDAKRLVDFAAGLIFGLRGTIERVTSKVFLLSPQNVIVAAEDKERIAGGFFNQS
jgi:cell division inhibitor SepF